MKPPAFQFYADDFLAGTVTMNHEERGLYILALCVQWNAGGLTREDFGRLGSTVVQPSLNHVLTKFEPGEDGLLRNARLEAEREKQKAFRDKQSVKGKASAEARFNRGSTVVQPDTQPEVNSPSPSPKTIEKRKFQRPTLDEIKAACAEIGLPEIEAEKFEAHHEARGWKYKQGMMKSWRGALTTWKLNFASGAFSFPAGQPRANQGGGQAAWKRINDLEAELKQLDGLLHAHMDRERNPDKVARREVVRAELSKLKANP